MKLKNVSTDQILELMEKSRNSSRAEILNILSSFVQEFEAPKDEVLNITYTDFLNIRSQAITVYKDKNFPIKIDNKELDSEQYASYAMLVATVDFLTGNEVTIKAVHIG